MVNTIHKSISIFELMYMAVQVNGIGVKVLVDTGATHTCVVATLGLKIEAYDSVATSLNGRDYWVEGIIILCSMEMGEWVGYYDLVVIHLRDFEMIIGMNFVTQVQVSIMIYLRTLVFMEKGTLCTLMTVENHAMETEMGQGMIPQQNTMGVG